jgi:hypothetical protein
MLRGLLSRRPPSAAGFPIAPGALHALGHLPLLYDDAVGVLRREMRAALITERASGWVERGSIDLMFMEETQGLALAVVFRVTGIRVEDVPAWRPGAGRQPADDLVCRSRDDGSRPRVDADHARRRARPLERALRGALRSRGRAGARSLNEARAFPRA